MEFFNTKIGVVVLLICAVVCTWAGAYLAKMAGDASVSGGNEVILIPLCFGILLFGITCGAILLNMTGNLLFGSRKFTCE